MLFFNGLHSNYRVHQMLTNVSLNILDQIDARTYSFKAPQENLCTSILGFQPRDKVAMLVVNTKEILWQNLDQNKDHFPAETSAFILDAQHGRHNVPCKQAIINHFETNHFLPVCQRSGVSFSRLIGISEKLIGRAGPPVGLISWT